MTPISPEIVKASLLIVAAIVFVGGLIGLIKGKSKASAIAGTISTLLLVGCYLVASMNELNGFIAGLVVVIALDVVFVKRLHKTKKFMPSGMILVICMGETFILLGNVAVGLLRTHINH
jgi:uncharacterized membrane protein (UPF0136 family)